VKPRGILFALLLAGLAIVCGWWFWKSRLERSQDDPIRAAAFRYGVPAALIKAVVWRESRFKPGARGSSGELGLMQIQEDAAREWAEAEHVSNFDHAQCLNPGTNTLAGTWYLHKLLKRYARTDDPIPYALADYNAGRANVLKWNSGAGATNSVVFLSQIGFPATRDYIESVVSRYEKYRRESSSRSNP
jgi:soluble lytic murein transglycosylase